MRCCGAFLARSVAVVTLPTGVVTARHSPVAERVGAFRGRGRWRGCRAEIAARRGRRSVVVDAVLRHARRTALGPPLALHDAAEGGHPLGIQFDVERRQIERWRFDHVDLAAAIAVARHHVDIARPTLVSFAASFVAALAGALVGPLAARLTATRVLAVAVRVAVLPRRWLRPALRLRLRLGCGGRSFRSAALRRDVAVGRLWLCWALGGRIRGLRNLLVAPSPPAPAASTPAAATVLARFVAWALGPRGGPFAAVRVAVRVAEWVAVSVVCRGIGADAGRHLG